jgi:3-hydroxyacyl-CoA dehydrogenase/enoyl-CoA hydratase/3-hydroxybutyryl-CoA epimerase
MPNDSLVQWRRAPVVAGGGDPGRKEGSATTRPASLPPDTAEELTHRLIFLMVNEAARCVEEGVIDSPEDADYGMILGTGFAPFRGGPLRFAEHFGLDKVVEVLERLAQSEEKFLPCEILKNHVRDGTKFYKE